jgi:methionyl-tRNA synthetase
VNNTFYITTAIPYVNSVPHVGFALEILLADVLARYQRLVGREVYFLTGTDDNSLKNVKAAEQEGIKVSDLVNRNAKEFRQLKDLLNLSNDDFIQTSSDPRHLPGVEKLWKACLSNGDIYKANYSGLYCVGCETFYNADDLTEGVCPEHLTKPELITEENYFFQLKKYQEKILQLIKSNTLRIEPAHYKNEVISFLEKGLENISISRAAAKVSGWGLAVPNDPAQIIYVWFDALGNYITALDYGSDGKNFQRYWVDGQDRIHVIGKGITKFHAIYWIAILLSAGVTLPSAIFVHGYLTVENQKISKSLGNTIAPQELVNRFGIESARHYFLKHIRSTQDNDFAIDRLIEAHNSELADQLGNLFSRVFGLIHRYLHGKVPQHFATTEDDQALITQATSLLANMAQPMQEFRIHDAAAVIWDFVREANRYITRCEPWFLAKDPAETAQQRLNTVLYNLFESLRIIALCLSPFLPTTAQHILQQVGFTDPIAAAINTDGSLIWGLSKPGCDIQPITPLFPKIIT